MEKWEGQTAQNAKGMDLSQNTLESRNKNKDKTSIIYDLNIYQLEQLDADGEYRHFGPWYIHVYEVLEGTIEEVSAPIELTSEEFNNLIANDPYFDEPDVWYGLEGFAFEKWDMLSDSLKMVFECLPKYKEDVSIEADAR
jgi:hypothetical protein